MKVRAIALVVVMSLVVLSIPVIHCHAGKKKTEDTADLHYRLGEEYFKNGDYLSALRELIKSVELDRKNPEAQYLLGTTYFHLGRYQDAERHLKIAIELKKGDREGYPEAHNNLGNVYLQTGRYDEAIAEFEKCLDVIFYQPNFPKVYYNIGVAYMKKGDMAKAMENFKQAVKMDPAFCPAYLNMGDILAKDKKHQEAILEYQKILDYCPSTPIAGRARLLMGVELNEIGQKGKACEQFFEVIKEMPNSELAVKAGEYIRLLQCQ
jgi:tetratricopeptide (TPR) repeat protein